MNRDLGQIINSLSHSQALQLLHAYRENMLPEDEHFMKSLVIQNRITKEVYDSRSEGGAFCIVCNDQELDDELVPLGVLTCHDCEVLRPAECAVEVMLANVDPLQIQKINRPTASDSPQTQEAV